MAGRRTPRPPPPVQAGQPRQAAGQVFPSAMEAVRHAPRSHRLRFLDGNDSRRDSGAAEAPESGAEWRKNGATARPFELRETPVKGSKFQPSRRSAVEPFLAMEVLQAAVDQEAPGKRVIHMEVGQPGAPAPRPVLEAARAALEDGRLRYTEALGLRRLRERIAHHYGDAYGIDVPYGGSRSPPAPRPASTSPSSRLSITATGSRWRPPAIRPTATSSTRSGWRSSTSRPAPTAATS